VAEFNVDAGNIPSSGLPDLTGVSRGATPNRMFETLFSGIGDAITGASKLADTAIKTNITDDIKAGVETLNQPLDNIPPELQNSASSMQALQTAYEQGKISDTYYYGTLNAQLKSLRTKYPGYEDFVDETMQSVTGVRPANAFRNAILSEINQQQQDASDTEKQWATWEKQNEADIIRVFPDYFQNPGKYNRDQVRAETVALKGVEAGIVAENTRINYLMNQGKLNDETAAEAATTALLQQANTFISGTSNALGFDTPDFMNRIANMATGGFSEEEYNGLIGQMNVAEAQLKANLLRTVQNPLEAGSTNSFSSILGATEANKLVDEAMAQFNLIKEMVVNKDFGMAGYYTRLNDQRNAKDTTSILNASPELRTYNTLAGIDPALAQIWLNEAGNQEAVLNVLGPELMARIVSGEDGFNEAIARLDASNQSPEEKGALANTMIDSALATITSGAATPEQMATAVSSVYALGSDGKDVFNMVTPDEYSGLYQRMFNPAVTAALTASGDTKSLQTYYEAARERLTAIPEFRRIAATVQDKVDWNKGISVQFDPSTGRLSVTGDQAASDYAGGGPLLDVGFRNLLRNANESVTELNNVFAIVNPMLDGLGVDKGLKAGVFQDILKDLNVDVERGKQEGFFDWLNKEVGNEIDIFLNSDATKAIAGAVQSDLQNTSDSLFAQTDDFTEFNFTQPAEPTSLEGFDAGVADETGLGNLDSYLASIRSAESGGNDNADNPLSSAYGRYQFTLGTWVDLVDKYPESGLTTAGRSDPQQQEIAIRLFTNDNSKALSRKGIAVNKGNLYAAHFLGATDATDVLRAPDDALVSQYVKPIVIQSNPFLRGMTVSRFKQWTAAKAS
jgi:hypothetical protein